MRSQILADFKFWSGDSLNIWECDVRCTTYLFFQSSIACIRSIFTIENDKFRCGENTENSRSIRDDNSRFRSRFISYSKKKEMSREKVRIFDRIPLPSSSQISRLVHDLCIVWVGEFAIVLFQWPGGQFNGFYVKLPESMLNGKSAGHWRLKNRHGIGLSHCRCRLSFSPFPVLHPHQKLFYPKLTLISIKFAQFKWYNLHLSPP